jgi:murein L,D-transpeptidase YcbB/YkuD
VLARLSASPDVDAELAGYNPRHEGYQALRRKLAEYRANRPATTPMVRRQPKLELTTQAIAILDDAPVMRPSGAYANPRLESDLIANMERWRWLPSELGERYVAVNIPEYRLRLMEGSQLVHTTRVITGKPDSPSPVFSGVMEYAVVNPSWYVPPSILKKDFLPKLAEDPGYAERQGYQVVRRGNAISVRQPPGERNALGFIKFMFPNGHAVYLHDTPNRSLFSTARRAFSHGCIRVENPFLLADFVLGHEWSEQRLKKLIGRGERTIFLPKKLPVHLTYFTLSVDESGELRSFEDIYGHDRRVRQALGLGA